MPDSKKLDLTCINTIRTLSIDAIDRVPKLQPIGVHAKEKFRNRQIACRRHAYEHGIDAPDITGWRWPNQ